MAPREIVAEDNSDEEKREVARPTSSEYKINQELNTDKSEVEAAYQQNNPSNIQPIDETTHQNDNLRAPLDSAVSSSDADPFEAIERMNQNQAVEIEVHVGGG